MFFFLVIDTAHASDNYSRFRKNLLETIIRDGKVEYNKNIGAALSSGKTDKNEFFTVEKMLSDRSRIIGQAKFTYSLLEKAFTTKNKKV